MKKLNFFYYLIAVSLFLSCESSDEEVDSAGNIVPDFSFTNEENLFEFKNLSVGATTYRWDLGDLSFYCDKENPTYRYTTSGGDINVTLTAMNDVGQEASVTKTITAPEYFDIEIDVDGDFEDWENVDVIHNESTSGTGSMQKIKIWGGGDNINFYIEGNTDMQMELVDMFINTDGDSSSGFLSFQWPESSGADYLFEGPLLTSSLGAFYQHTAPDGAWGWAALAGSGENLTSSGIVSLDSETNAIEFSIPKIQLGSLGSTIGIAITELTIGWALVANFPEVTDTSSFIIYELPIESSSLCE